MQSLHHLSHHLYLREMPHHENKDKLVNSDKFEAPTFSHKYLHPSSKINPKLGFLTYSTDYHLRLSLIDCQTARDHVKTVFRPFFRCTFRVISSEFKCLFMILTNFCYEHEHIGIIHTLWVISYGPWYGSRLMVKIIPGHNDSLFWLHLTW